jgi:hypothetical protein
MAYAIALPMAHFSRVHVARHVFQAISASEQLL